MDATTLLTRLVEVIDAHDWEHLPGVLHRQAAVADEVTLVRLDHPEAEAVLGVVALLPRDPALGVVAGARRPVAPERVEPDEHPGDLVEVVHRHRSEAEALGRLGQHGVRLVVGCMRWPRV
jgi:hypothetical protein